MPRHTIEDDFVKNKTPTGPRLRVNSSTNLTLNKTFKRLEFQGNDPLNINTFPTLDNGEKKVTFDPANNKFIFNNDDDRDYNVTFYYTIRGGLRPCSFQLQFEIDAPTDNDLTGGVRFFPFPRQGGFLDLPEVGGRDDVNQEYSTEIYTTPDVRQFGLAVNIRVDPEDRLLGKPTLVEPAIIIRPSN